VYKRQQLKLRKSKNLKMPKISMKTRWKMTAILQLSSSSILMMRKRKKTKKWARIAPCFISCRLSVAGF
jgi:hypothetical protein